VDAAVVDVELRQRRVVGHGCAVVCSADQAAGAGVSHRVALSTWLAGE